MAEMLTLSAVYPTQVGLHEIVRNAVFSFNSGNGEARGRSRRARTPSPPRPPTCRHGGRQLPASQEDNIHLRYSFYKKPVIQQASCFSEACEPF